MAYIWERPEWPRFLWDQGALAVTLADARHRQGVLLGEMRALGFRVRQEANLATLTEDVVQTSDIEGEKLDRAQVRSSIARKLGLEVAGLVRAERHVEGIVEVMLDATRDHAEPLTRKRLFGWHAALFPTARSGMRPIRVGGWRDDRAGPMQVVSGPIGRERVHFVAPPAERLDAEVGAFLDWFNRQLQADPVLASGVAHLWFVTIHPFDDGNGRIARALADMLLARSEASAERFYSMSSRLREDRDGYYRILEETQRGDLDITGWLQWFLASYCRAVDHSRLALQGTLRKARFCERWARQPLNDRQRKILNRLLDGLEGKLTTSKWAAMAKCSQDTAYRDILDLVARGILLKDPPGGRSASYSLADPEQSAGA